jgi:hypothetical protein
MPPLARSSRTTMPTVGVAAMPQSRTSCPSALSVRVISDENVGPDSRPSLPITIGPAGRVEAKAVA